MDSKETIKTRERLHNLENSVSVLKAISETACNDIHEMKKNIETKVSKTTFMWIIGILMTILVTILGGIYLQVNANYGAISNVQGILSTQLK